MRTQPIISVITINYNDGDKLARTIKSVINQDYNFIEYIVVDGFSTDQSLAVANQYAHKLTVISEPDRGLYDAMNKGIKRASGEWLIFMNSGDCFYNRFVLSNIFSINRDEMNIIYGDCEICYGGFSVKKLAEQDQSKLWMGGNFSHQSLFTRRKLLDDLEFQYEQFPIAADFNLIYSLSMREVFFYCGLVISSVDAGGLSDIKRLNSIREHKKAIDQYPENVFSRHFYYIYLLVDAMLRLTLKKILPQQLVAYFIKTTFMGGKIFGKFRWVP